MMDWLRRIISRPADQSRPNGIAAQPAGAPVDDDGYHHMRAELDRIERLVHELEVERATMRRGRPEDQSHGDH